MHMQNLHFRVAPLTLETWVHSLQEKLKVQRISCLFSFQLNIFAIHSPLYTVSTQKMVFSLYSGRTVFQSGASICSHMYYYYFLYFGYLQYLYNQYFSFFNIFIIAFYLCKSRVFQKQLLYSHKDRYKVCVHPTLPRYSFV